MSPHYEGHWTIREIAQELYLSDKTTRRLFVDEPSVSKIPVSKPRRIIRCSEISLAIMAIVNTGIEVPDGLLEFLNSKWRGGKTCSICGTNTWSVSPQLAELRPLSLAGFLLGGVTVTPLIVLTCNNCGNTVLINALKAGWQPPTQGQPVPGGGR